MAQGGQEQALIYQKIAHYLEDQILKQVYLPEQSVPSSNQLAKEFSINPATANKGLNCLVEQGILYKKRGLGMFVAAEAGKMIQEKRKAELVQHYIQPLLLESQILSITLDELIKMITLQDIFGEKTTSHPLEKSP